MWSPIRNFNYVQTHPSTTLSYIESGGGGDCFFCSVAFAIGRPGNFMSIRESAASAVVLNNVPDVLIDMSGQIPQSLNAKMDLPSERSRTGTNSDQQFIPEKTWNDSNGNVREMVVRTKNAIKTPGNHFWGDITTAALVEISENINIIVMSLDTCAPIKITSSEQHQSRDNIDYPIISQNELDDATTLFGRWVTVMLKLYPDMTKMQDVDIVRCMTRLGLTREKAMYFSRIDSIHRKSWLKGRRQPLGSIRALCHSENNDASNISIDGYSSSKPTIILWNISNVHWVPIGVGPHFQTMIEANSPFREFVDRLLLI
jgi:hypothetical protein